MANPGEFEPPIRVDYPDPLWIQAVRLIRDQINSGSLTEGMRLPPERELCQQLGISRVTLRKALTQLVDDGVLAPSHGRGWYVGTANQDRDWSNDLESFSETAKRMGLEPSSEVVTVEERPASLDEAEALGVAPGTPLFRLDRVRLLADVPIARDETLVPAALMPDVADVDFSTASLFSVLGEAGLAPERAESTIQARAADASLAESLRMQEGEPILEMHQIAYAADDRKVSMSRIRYAGDRYRLRTGFARGAH
ncbi:GntR family transcriptional regulator [Mycetocola saprophilus]|uniref:GntR family transcriptional regulator n=1 Tax=Mycetocola saprophilus TaxID=76636 RepID=UPI003BF31700